MSQLDVKSETAASSQDGGEEGLSNNYIRSMEFPLGLMNCCRVRYGDGCTVL